MDSGIVVGSCVGGVERDVEEGDGDEVMGFGMIDVQLMAWIYHV